MDRRNFIAFSLLAGCGGGHMEESSPPAPKKIEGIEMSQGGLSKMWKETGVMIDPPNETTPLVYNGKLLAISTPRDAFAAVAVEVRDYFTGQMIASPAWSGIFGSAVVDDAGKIHVFGATGGNGLGNKVIHAELDSNFVPSSPEVAWSPNPACDRVWNTSVCRDPTGYVMVLETLFPESLSTTAGFNLIFNRATSLDGPWTSMGSNFNYSPNPPHSRLFEAYCPTIKFRNGWYYLFYAHLDGSLWKSYVARSQTLQSGSWQFRWDLPVLVPDGDAKNASDFDYTEFDGRCWGTYFSGDQVNTVPVKRCMYPGTEEQFLAEFFPIA